MVLLPNLLWAAEPCSSEDLTIIGKQIDACQQRIDNQPHSKIILYQASTELHELSTQMQNCITLLEKNIAMINESYSIIKSQQQDIKIAYFKTRAKQLETELKNHTQILVLSQYLHARIDQVQLHTQKQLYHNTTLFMHEQSTPFILVVRDIISKKLYSTIHFQQNIHDSYFKMMIPHRFKFILVILFCIFSLQCLSHIKKYQHWRLNIPEVLITFIFFSLSQPVIFQIIKIDFSHSFDIYLREYETYIIRFLGLLNLLYLLKYFKVGNRWLSILKVIFASVTLALSYYFILQANYLELYQPNPNQAIYLFQYLSYIMIMLTIYGNMKWLVMKSIPFNLNKYVPWMTKILFIMYIILFVVALDGYLYFAFSVSLSVFIITIFIWWTITGLSITNDAIQTLYSEDTMIGKWLHQFISLEKYHSKDIKIIIIIIFAGILWRVTMIIWNNWYLSPGIYLKIQEHISITLNIFEFSISPLSLFRGILFFSFFKIIIRFSVRLISKHLSTVREIEYRVERTLYAIGVSILFFLALRISGIELKHLAIAAGALSFGIGVGLQDIMRNIISGILMMIYNPIAKNDYIHVKEFRGYIKKFSLLTTQIETLDNTDVMIPNRYILDSILENFTYKNNKFHKIHLKFYLNNLEDFHRAKKTILKFLSTQKEVLLLDTSYAPLVLIHPENANGIELEVICTLKQFENEDKTISDMYLNIIPILKKEKIDFQLNNIENT